MKQWRLILHPVLGHRRSRLIFLSYLLAAALSNGILWWLVFRALKNAHLLIYFQTFHPSWYVEWLVSPIVQIAGGLLAVLIGASTTATYVIGPVKRLEQWLKDWEAGHSLAPFKVRDHDYLYENIAALINQLHEQRARK